jgi:hypothetical protein
MKRSYKKVITILNKLENIWDNDLILVADNSHLLLIHYESKEILADFIGIICDGGDAGSYAVDGKEYWDIENTGKNKYK